MYLSCKWTIMLSYQLEWALEWKIKALVTESTSLCFAEMLDQKKDKTSGRKRPRVDDYDITPAPDSIKNTLIKINDFPAEKVPTKVINFCILLYIAKAWQGESLVNLTNPPWFSKLKPSKLTLTINNLLADILIRQTFFCQMLKNIQFAKLY